LHKKVKDILNLGEDQCASFCFQS